MCLGHFHLTTSLGIYDSPCIGSFCLSALTAWQGFVICLLTMRVTTQLGSMFFFDVPGASKSGLRLEMSGGVGRHVNFTLK